MLRVPLRVVCVAALASHISLLRPPALDRPCHLQFTASAFYDPARKAMLPVLVPEADLHLATTVRHAGRGEGGGSTGASLGLDSAGNRPPSAGTVWCSLVAHVAAGAPWPRAPGPCCSRQAAPDAIASQGAV